MWYHSSSTLQAQPILVVLSFCAAAHAAVIPSDGSTVVVERLFPLTNSTELPDAMIGISPCSETKNADTNTQNSTVLPAAVIDGHPYSNRVVLSKEQDTGTAVSDYEPEDADRNYNYCKYSRSHFGFNRYWLVIAPDAHEEDIPGWCGGLWDNLKRWASCSPVSQEYCGIRRGEDEGKPGLQWEFKITDTCHSGYMNSVWWEATKGELGEMKCMKDPRPKVI